MDPMADAPTDPQRLPQAILQWQPRYHRARAPVVPLTSAGLAAVFAIGAAFLGAVALGLMLSGDEDR